MKDGIECIVNGLPQESLGVLASLRETQIQVERERWSGREAAISPSFHLLPVAAASRRSPCR